MRSSFRPRKRFGQHFLCAPDIIDAIVAAVAPHQHDHIVEIGPGLGAMTQPLLQLCQRLDAIEIDNDLAQYQRRIHTAAHFHLHHCDALTFDLATLSATDCRVVGNLPYNITTPLLFHLFQQRQFICDMHFMLQKEVADRLCATVGSRDYGKLSVMAQYHCQISRLFDISPAAFDPPPRVMSTFIRLTWVNSSPTCVQRLQYIVQQAFNQRRKTIQNSLRSVCSPEQLRACGIEPSVRAQDVSVAQFVCLSQALP